MGTHSQLKVPLLIGHNADEGLFWASTLPKTVSAYRDFVRTRFPAHLADAVLARYPAATDAEVAAAGPRMNGDVGIIAPTVLTARAASKTTDVYMYRFSRVAPSNRSAWGGAAHTTEVPYVFDNTLPTRHSSTTMIAPCLARWPTRGCSSQRPEIQTASGCLNGLRTVRLTIDCSTSAIA